MKLKKIASLMLAGVMAVSMLAGCSTNGNGGNGGEGEGEGTSTSGYSVALREMMSDKVKDMENVTFQDNATYAAALEKAVKNIGSDEVLKIVNNNGVPESIEDWGTGGHVKMINDLKDAFDVKDNDLDESDMNLKSIVDDPTNLNRTAKDAVVYAVDGTVGVTEALEYIADRLNPYFEALPEEGVSSNDEEKWDYSYVISVSIANRALEPFAGYTNSVNYIAVCITRTATTN